MKGEGGDPKGFLPPFLYKRELLTIFNPVFAKTANGKRGGFLQIKGGNTAHILGKNLYKDMPKSPPCSKHFSKKS